MEKLNSLALAMLGKHDGDPEKTVRPFDRVLKKNFNLRKEMELDYLNRLVKGGESQTTVDTRASGALPKEDGGHNGLDILSSSAAEAGTDAGQLHDDTQERLARTIPVKPHDRNIKKKFWRHPPRSEEEKEAARHAMLVRASVFEEFKVDKLKWRELKEEARERATRAVDWLTKGHDEMTQTLFICLLDQHIQPSDSGALVPQVINEDTGRELALRALRMTPAMASEVMSATRNEIVSQAQRLIAAE